MESTRILLSGQLKLTEMDSFNYATVYDSNDL